MKSSRTEKIGVCFLVFFVLAMLGFGPFIFLRESILLRRAVRDATPTPKKFLMGVWRRLKKSQGTLWIFLCKNPRTCSLKLGRIWRIVQNTHHPRRKRIFSHAARGKFLFLWIRLTGNRGLWRCVRPNHVGIFLWYRYGSYCRSFSNNSASDSCRKNSDAGRTCSNNRDDWCPSFLVLRKPIQYLVKLFRVGSGGALSTRRDVLGTNFLDFSRCAAWRGSLETR